MHKASVAYVFVRIAVRDLLHRIFIHTREAARIANRSARHDDSFLSVQEDITGADRPTLVLHVIRSNAQGVTFMCIKMKHTP